MGRNVVLDDGRGGQVGCPVDPVRGVHQTIGGAEGGACEGWDKLLRPLICRLYSIDHIAKPSVCVGRGEAIR